MEYPRAGTTGRALAGIKQKQEAEAAELIKGAGNGDDPFGAKMKNSKRRSRRLMNKEERFRKIVAEHLGVDANEVPEHASFIDDLGADSLDMAELVILAENEFGIEISESEWEQALTVGDALKLISQAAKGRP